MKHLLIFVLFVPPVCVWRTSTCDEVVGALAGLFLLISLSEDKGTFWQKPIRVLSVLNLIKLGSEVFHLFKKQPHIFAVNQKYVAVSNQVEQNR